MKYRDKIFLDLRDKSVLKFILYDMPNGKQTKYYILKYKNQKCTKIIKRYWEFEGTITKLLPYLKEIVL